MACNKGLGLSHTYHLFQSVVSLFFPPPLSIPPSPQLLLSITSLMSSKKCLFLCPSRVFVIWRSTSSQESACNPSSNCKAHIVRLEVTFYASQLPQVSHASSLQWIERYVSHHLSIWSPSHQI